MNELVWTDELAKEYGQLCAECGYSGHTSLGKMRINDILQSFKASKQPKPEWEIVNMMDPDNSEIHPWHHRSCSNHGCKIHSVKRLSDGEVFTVGDEAHSPEGGKEFIRPITEFTIEGNDIRVHFREFGRLLQHVKKRVRVIPVLLTPSQIEKLHTLLNTH